MIIVNQSKDELVNFDNIMCINIIDCEEDGYLISAGFIVGRDDNYRDLGYYKTEKRAKEVLREIVAVHKFNRSEATGQKNAVYEMPKE